MSTACGSRALPAWGSGMPTRRAAALPADAVQPGSRAAWRRWLEQNHERTRGIWFVTYKKSTGRPRVEYEEAVEEALCFGWIDSTARTLDAERSMLYFAPRKRGSGWSRSNKIRVARLHAAGLMASPGLARIEAAQRDGSWTILDSVESLEVPDDLAAALQAYPNASAHFHAFPPSARRAILQWIVLARKADTRSRRVAEAARLAEQNIRANQPRS